MDIHPKKVLICRTALLPASETFIEDQAMSCSRWKPVLVGIEPVANGLSLQRLNVRYLDGREPGAFAKARQRLMSELNLAPRRLVKLIEEERPNLIHVHFGLDAVAFWPAVRKSGLPMVVTLHGYDINTNPQAWKDSIWPSRTRYPERLLRLAQDPRVSFVAVSQAIKKRAIEYGIAADRVHVKYIGVNLSIFQYSGVALTQRKKNILFVGRLVAKKGAEILIRAYACVRQQVTDCGLTIVGAGPLQSSLARLAQELNVPVEFRGVLKRGGVKNELDQCRVLCLPSIVAPDGDAEGLGMVILEAQACGVPVVTSALGGATEAIVDGVTGFAFREGNVIELSERLAKLLKDAPLAESMSKAAVLHVRKHFDIRSCTGALEAHYDDLLMEVVPVMKQHVGHR